MIRVTRDSLDKIRNRALAYYCLRYVQMEEQFAKAVSDHGLSFGEFNSSEDLHKSVSSVSENNRKSYCTGEMSVACKNCKTGEGATTFVLTLACNRDCYFCTNKNQIDYDELQECYNDVVAEFDEFAKSQTVKSVALTGGEPLLLPEICEEFYTHVKSFNKSIHTRLYTNGDLVTEKIMERLTPYLDEIRVGIKWEEDETINLEEAAKVLSLCSRFDIDVVIEMPVLPGGYEEMVKLIEVAEDKGVSSINVLEYLFAWNHAEDYSAKEYKIKNPSYKVPYAYDYAGGLPVDGSEKEALKLIEYCMDKDLKCAVHYCSLENKLSSQIFHQNRDYKPMPYELLSCDDYFIKSLKVFGGDIAKAKSVLDSSSYTVDGDMMEVHPSESESLFKVGIDEILLCHSVVEDFEGRRVIREAWVDMLEQEDKVK